MRAIKALMLMIPLAIHAIAQDSPQGRKNEYRIDFTPGIGCLCAIQNGEVNKILQTNGLPALPQSMLSTHIGIGFSINRFSIATLFKGYVSHGDQESGSYRLSGGGAAFEWRLQYDVTHSDKFFITPYAGLGTQQFGFTFDSNTSRDLNTAIQVAVNPYDVRQLNLVELYGSGGLSIGLARKYSNVGYQLGLQAGYQFVTRAEWRLDDELLQTPSASFSGMEIKLSISLLFALKPKNRAVNSSNP